MILVDSSVWIDHLRARDEVLMSLLVERRVAGHPFILGEVALGSIANRDVVVEQLKELPQLAVAEDAEVMALIDRHRLFGRGIGYVDAHLLAAVRLTPAAGIWTRDRRLHQAAVELDVASGVLH
ncbi:type II toxin-antitoxin system VapC family toxin [Indioceanicola profundi]|uniref:type II toxin-antitoxin system VapC family toxin n=1 Tax=Indioceanicola profundi TaxID=2220096 RepID=UPI000E6AC7CE|nr:PIN domain-containing protein [Indioceanicola profundi]